MTARDQLDRALVALAAEGQRPPCGQTVPSLHLSEDRDERARAVQACTACPVIAACRDAADEGDERFGVWGGVDRTARPASRSTTTRGTRGPAPSTEDAPRREQRPTGRNTA